MTDHWRNDPALPSGATRDRRPWDKIRLRNPATRGWLHLSGHGETDNLDWSWLGTREQARTLRDRARTRGDAWPFRAVHRDDATR